MADSLEICMKAALAGGNAISDYKPKNVTTKGYNPYVGRHAIVTDADFRSQKAILAEIMKIDSNCLAITEEVIDDKSLAERMITPESLGKMSGNRVYIIDELDGTSSFRIEHYEWSASVGCVENMNHTAGAVFAPKIKEGSLFFASEGNGTFVRTKNKTSRIKVGKRKMSDAYVIFGVDCFLKKYPIHNKMLVELGDISRTSNANGSCALALGMVAAGMADLLVQPLQSPWDWAAGKLLVEEAGGAVLFYEIAGSEIIPVKKLEPRHYDPSKRAVGFVAGNENLAVEALKMLAELGE